MTAPPPAWADLPFFRDRWPAVAAALARERRPVLPPDDARFLALALTPPEAVRVVILGQDPYPTPGHAMGLAFSVPPGTRPLPPSLRNILRELAADTGQAPEGGDLTPWAQQGVLLLNTHLSVAAGEPGSHARLGWETLAAEVLARVSARPTAFVLWGAHAQRLGAHLAPGDHLVVESAHPSPLAARRGFFGSRPFSRVDAWLAARGEAPVRWGAPLPPAAPLG